MTPQIKFRGFRVDGKGWVEGMAYSILTEEDGIKSCIVTDISWDGTMGFKYQDAIKCIEIHPSSLGMFTGRTDKNGKEIYGAIGENGGDKIKLTTEFIGFVKYRYGAFVIESEINGEYFFSEELPLSLCAEIIGNQWEVDNGK